MKFFCQKICQFSFGFLQLLITPFRLFVTFFWLLITPLRVFCIVCLSVFFILCMFFVNFNSFANDHRQPLPESCIRDDPNGSCTNHDNPTTSGSHSESTPAKTTWKHLAACKTQCDQYLKNTTQNCSDLLAIGNSFRDSSLCGNTCKKINPDTWDDTSWDNLNKQTKIQILEAFENSFTNRNACLKNSKNSLKPHFLKACVKKLTNLKKSNTTQNGICAGQLCPDSSEGGNANSQSKATQNCNTYCGTIYNHFFTCTNNRSSCDGSSDGMNFSMVGTHIEYSNNNKTNIPIAYLAMAQSNPMDSLQNTLSEYLNDELFKGDPAKNINPQSKGNNLLDWGISCKGNCAASCKNQMRNAISEAQKKCEKSYRDASDCCNSPLSCVGIGGAHTGDVVSPVVAQLRVASQQIAGMGGNSKAFCEALKIGSYANAGLQGAMGGMCLKYASSCQSTCEEEETKVKKLFNKFCGIDIEWSDQDPDEISKVAKRIVEDADGTTLSCEKNFLKTYLNRTASNISPYISKCEATGRNGNGRIMGMTMEVLSAYIAGQAGCGNPTSSPPPSPPPPSPGPIETPGSDVQTRTIAFHHPGGDDGERRETNDKPQGGGGELPDFPDGDPEVPHSPDSSPGGLVKGGIVGGAPAGGSGGGGGGGSRRGRGKNRGSSSGSHDLQYRSSKFGGYGGGSNTNNGVGSGSGRSGKNAKKRKMASLNLDELMKKKKELNRLKNRFGNSHENLFNRISNRFKWACKYKMSCLTNLR